MVVGGVGGQGAGWLPGLGFSFGRGATCMLADEEVQALGLRAAQVFWLNASGLGVLVGRDAADMLLAFVRWWV